MIIVKWKRVNNKWVKEKIGGSDEITIDDLLDTVDKPNKSIKKKVEYFPDDKIWDVKLKIAYTLGIPVFRQHLWTVIGGQTVPLSYRINVSGIPIAVDILSTEGDKLFDIPIDPYLFNNKEYIKVIANDQFTLLNDMQEINLVDLDEFITEHRTSISKLEDKYQLNAIYYGFILKYYPLLSFDAFAEYIATSDINTSYPLLQHTPYELSYLQRQTEICHNAYELQNDKSRVKRIKDMLKTSLTETTLRVDSSYKHKIINFRNLFDLLELDEIVDGIQLYDIYNSKHILIDKYRDYPINEQLIPHVMYLRVVIQRQPRHTLDLYMYINGTYSIKAKFGEDINMDFDDINRLVDKFINPIIRKINSFERQVMYNGEKLETMNKSNVIFTDINISMFWKRSITSGEFGQMRGLLNDFASAKIIQEKEIDKTVSQYYFKRGMFEYDSQRIEKSITLDNYYQYLSNSDIRQKWSIIFDNTRVFTVMHRFSDIKFDITGIKEDEYDIYIQYVVYLLSEFMYNRKVDNKMDINVKSLNNLKEQDPKLYKIKAIYNSDVIYSKECQKPFQPKIYTQQQYDSLDKSEKTKIVKYWNFTSNTDAYYQCPNPKYPHLRFIVGKHPMNYCLPCCKITDPNDGKQGTIFDECLKNHVYNKTNAVFISNSRYIMNYGKPVDIGRLSNLPSSINTLIAEEGSTYYLYGVPQNYENVECGLINCIAHALGIETDIFIEQILSVLSKNKHYFSMLCNNTVATMFNTMDEFIDDIKRAYLGKPNIFKDFCQLMIDVAPLLNIQLLIFDNNNTIIQYRIHEYLSNVIDMQYPEATHIMVLHNRASGNWNPIYKIQKDIYFRTGIISARVFPYDSAPVQNIIEMVKTKLGEQVNNHFDIGVLRNFCSASNYKITQLYMNNSNLCYGVNIAKLGYVPIETSFVKGENTTYSFKPVLPNYKNLKKFIDKYNKWNLNVSENAGFIRIDVQPNRPQIERVEPMYPLLEIKRIYSYKNKPIGFECQNLVWYCSGAPRQNMYNLVCHPLDINEKLGIAGAEDARTKNVHRALYKNNLYQILVLKYIKVFNESRNKKIRGNLSNLIKDKSLRTPGFNIDEILTNIINPDGNTPLANDIQRLKIHLLDSILKGQTNDEIIKSIENEHFNFDMMFIEKLKNMSRDKIIDALQKVAQGFVIFQEPKDFEFPNIISSCDKSYCRNNKLMISKNKLNDYVEILADQIKNPFIQKYLFNPVYQKYLVDYFAFTKRDNEIIEVSFP